MKPVVFLGDSLERVREFPKHARSTAGFELRQVQQGLDPTNWRPMTSIGSGVREIRITDAAGAFRVIYVASRKDAIYVLHAFQKKRRVTSASDLRLATDRFRRI